jgi:HNH endonuclease
MRTEKGFRMLPVHILMLETFIGPRPEGMLALHCDDDPLHCVLSNLKWGTPSENTQQWVTRKFYA